jgi:O-antigen/teichoic acid export membrane protein
MKSETNTSLLNLAVKSTLWLFLSRGILFFLNLFRRILLLRLLVAQDFGVFAIALLVIEVVETFSNTGIDQALIQKKEEITPFLDSAWTLNIIRSFAIYAVCFLIAPVFASFFDSPESISVIRVLSLIVVITAFNNIGVIYYKKDLNFKFRVFIELCTSSLGLLVLLAYLLCISRSIWAMVWARLASSVVQCLLTYFMHPYRPRLTLQYDKIKELWSFGKHVWGTRMLKYICFHGDDILLGKIAGTVVLGYYRQAFDIGNMVAKEVGNKVSEVAFPLYSKVQNNIGKIRSGYLKLFSLTAFAMYPVTGILFIFATEITEHVFGDRWLPMVPVLKILCFLGPLKSSQRAPVFLSLGRPDIVRKMQQWRFFFMAILIFPLTLKWGMVGTASTLLISEILLQGYSFHQLKKMIGISFKDFAGVLVPPLSLTVAMVSALFFAKTHVPDMTLWILIGFIISGVVLFLCGNIILSVVYKEHKIFAYFKEIMRSLRTP